MQKGPKMTVFKNKFFTKRDYECTNVVACVADQNPDPSKWEAADESTLQGLTPLWIERGVRVYGYL